MSTAVAAAVVLDAVPAPTLAERIGALGTLLERIAVDFRPAALASSLSAEDMVLTDAILAAGLPIEIFTLDTGRLHGDTLAVIDAVRARYHHAIRVVRPDDAQVAEYVASHGANAFYTSVELRKRCCEIRKVRPLAHVLRGFRAWLTGLRRAQAVTRDGLEIRAFDAAHGIEKFSPLADWSEHDVWAYIRSRNVPYNRLHDQGYPSIGCAPCTRPVAVGEDLRAGRWWWEPPETKECGLHAGADGRLVRSRSANARTP
jgi:phosphoadenosine phosphosulfate reductase